jgi:exopolysaccharide production protein ExoZ
MNLTLDDKIMSWIKNTFEISHTTHKAIVSMEGIRGFAVFLVFLVHYVTLVDPWLTETSITKILSEYVRSIGNTGVDLFFVLSGYLIYGMLIKKKKAFGSYLKRRIQRIYPTFTAVFIIYLLLSAAFHSESKIPDGWEGLVFVIQNYLLLPGLFDIKAITTVAWSLSYEFFYYLLIPLLISFLGLREWKFKMRAALFLCASIFLFSYFAIYGGHIRLLMFISGILLFEVTENKKAINIPPIGLPALAIAIVSVIILKAFEANGWWNIALLFILFFIFCLDCFTSDGLANKVFKYSPIRWLGNMSYSYYLIHGLSLKFLFIILPIFYPPMSTSDWLEIQDMRPNREILD